MRLTGRRPLADLLSRLPGGARPALLVLALVLAVPAAAGLRALPARADAATPCEFEKVERIVAVGDVHGAYDRLVEILRAASVIDARNRWIGGRTHLVQTGDVLDRGPDSRQALEFLRRLARDADRQGGKVHALIGNHEVMRLLGDFRYVVPREYAAFTNPNSEATRRAVIDRYPAEQRARVEADTPLGMIEMIRALGPGQDLGKYLRTLDTVVRINGIVFTHGGISPAVAPMTCADINDTVRRELGPDLENTRANPGASLAARADGPLWYRGLASEPDSFAGDVKKMLAAQHARAIVVGHSAAPGPIRHRFGDTVFLIDTGMQPAYLPTGRASALEIRGDVFTAIYNGSRQVIAGSNGLSGGVQ